MIPDPLADITIELARVAIAEGVTDGAVCSVDKGLGVGLLEDESAEMVGVTSSEVGDVAASWGEPSLAGLSGAVVATLFSAEEELGAVGRGVVVGAVEVSCATEVAVGAGFTLVEELLDGSKSGSGVGDGGASVVVVASELITTLPQSSPVQALTGTGGSQIPSTPWSNRTQ